jgi:hypothetical protein
LRKVHPDASLADATSSIPWITLTRLFDITQCVAARIGTAAGRFVVRDGPRNAWSSYIGEES